MAIAELELLERQKKQLQSDIARLTSSKKEIMQDTAVSEMSAEIRLLGQKKKALLADLERLQKTRKDAYLPIIDLTDQIKQLEARRDKLKAEVIGLSETKDRLKAQPTQDIKPIASGELKILERDRLRLIEEAKRIDKALAERRKEYIEAVGQLEVMKKKIATQELTYEDLFKSTQTLRIKSDTHYATVHVQSQTEANARMQELEEKENELKLMKEEVEAIRSATNQKEEDIKRRESALLTQATLLDEKEQNVLRLSEDVDSRELELRHHEQVAINNKNETDALKKQAQKLNDKAQEMRDRIANELGSKEAALEERSARVEIRLQEVVKAKAVIEEHRKILDKRKKKIDDDAARQKRVWKEIKEKESRL